MRAEVFSRDVQEFLRCLAAREVRYVVIGGMAVIYHGYARLTGDVDFLYDCAPTNTERLWAALGDFWGGSVPAVQGPADSRIPSSWCSSARRPTAST